MVSVGLARTIFDDAHEDFRRAVRAFVERDVAPHLEEWDDAGRVDRELFRKAASMGLLGMSAPERFGGGGIDDFRYSAVLLEELARVGAHGVSMALCGFNDLVSPYFTAFGSDSINERYLAPMIAGEKVGAVAFTEPGAGSDLASMAMTGRREGDRLVLNGAKTFISNGLMADVLVVAVRTDPEAGRSGFSLVCVDSHSEGLARSGPLRKVGLGMQDTAELFFDDVRVPRADVLGVEGQGWAQLRRNLPIERLHIAVSAMAAMRATFEHALSHTTERRAFGQRIADFQANRFYLAELATEIEVTQAFVDRCILDAAEGTLDEVTAAMAKWWTTELQQRVVQRAVQLHGGYGYMKEYRVARDFMDSRVTTIFGGTTEIMKEIIGRRITREG
ncbi:acyl-CoA dehydrogenase [Salinibacterium sp. dk2585]|uniref:acyl-CoA dehydrogenase family protein n=1 Tax=unclassified Salinibacterium TaxID=2632331 RepID=UPI0011C254F5|nr:MULTISPECIES: acyl-CoA dehydrogenase family protein [unclassified Salinibacterium]QEE60357.1 acyl-CoA dehydrogenase [Salinibacterium sp. dk2585]TXK55430.1 acyl-CoA dehydrogenase [Salinibacterium sp. dk5596]